jgi:hypothetical protein
MDSQPFNGWLSMSDAYGIGLVELEEQDAESVSCQ